MRSPGAGHRLLRLSSSLAILLLSLAAPSPAPAQLFLASRPDPPFAIGPLTVRASVAERAGPTAIDVLWGLMLPPSADAALVAQDLYLLWPGEVLGETTGPRIDPALARAVEAQGFDIVGEGRAALFALGLTDGDGGPREDRQPNGATYVVFVQTGGPEGLSPPASLIRIPWTPRLADRAWLMNLRFAASGLVKPRRETWAERLIVGGRSVLTLTFNEVRERPLFAMYLANRDRVVRLADAPSELVATFAGADRVKIDQVFPPTSIRRLSETLESTEVVSLFLDKSDGITPQHLSVQFGYFSSVQAWALVLVPALFFALGQAMGPMIGRGAMRLARFAAVRVHVGRWNAPPRHLESGRILPRETLARIAPGRSTRDDVLRLCGTPDEEHEEVGAPGRETLIYRGRRVVPSARRIFGWLSTVRHREVERHEVRVVLEQGVVSDLQATVRRYRLAAGEPE